MFQTLHEIPKNLICSGIMLCHNSCYYFKMYISEITKFPCLLQKKNQRHECTDVTFYDKTEKKQLNMREERKHKVE